MKRQDGLKKPKCKCETSLGSPHVIFGTIKQELSPLLLVECRSETGPGWLGGDAGEYYLQQLRLALLLPLLWL